MPRLSLVNKIRNSATHLSDNVKKIILNAKTMEIYFLLILISSVFSVLAYYEPAIENVADPYECNQFSNREQSKRKSDRQNQNNDEDFDDNDAPLADDEITSYDDFNANYQDRRQAFDEKIPVEDDVHENSVQARSLYKRESKDLNSKAEQIRE